MDFPLFYRATTPQQTQEFGKSLATHVTTHPEISGATVLTLSGPLGAGKTTLLQGFASGLGLSGRLTSPTFIIAKEYLLPSQLYFFHVDLYRLTEGKEIEGIGLQEVCKNPAAIVAIEWPEKLGKLTMNRYELHLTVLSDEEREITVIYKKEE